MDVAGVIDSVVGARPLTRERRSGRIWRWPRCTGWSRHAQNWRSRTGGRPRQETGSPRSFDAGQDSVANFDHLTDQHLAFGGSVPPSHVADLLALPAADRQIVHARPVCGPERAGDPPDHLRVRQAGGPDPLTDLARRPVRRVRSDPRQSRPPASARQDPPPHRQRHRRDRDDQRGTSETLGLFDVDGCGGRGCHGGRGYPVWVLV